MLYLSHIRQNAQEHIQRQLCMQGLPKHLVSFVSYLIVEVYSTHLNLLFQELFFKAMLFEPFLVSSTQLIPIHIFDTVFFLFLLCNQHKRRHSGC